MKKYTIKYVPTDITIEVAVTDDETTAFLNCYKLIFIRGGLCKDCALYHYACNGIPCNRVIRKDSLNGNWINKK